MPLQDYTAATFKGKNSTIYHRPNHSADGCKTPQSTQQSTNQLHTNVQARLSTHTSERISAGLFLQITLVLALPRDWLEKINNVFCALRCVYVYFVELEMLDAGNLVIWNQAAWNVAAKESW